MTEHRHAENTGVGTGPDPCTIEQLSSPGGGVVGPRGDRSMRTNWCAIRRMVHR